MIKDKVFQEDVMKTLKRIPDNSIDMIWGDPDYGVGISYSGHKFQTQFEKYMKWYIALNKECIRVLKGNGNIFMMNYPRQNAHLQVKYLENVAHVSEYVWVYPTNVGHSPRRFTTAHRTILHATKTRRNKFYKDQVALPYRNPEDRRIRERVANGSKGRMPYSWFERNLVKNTSQEKTTHHPCQIPVSIIEMFLNATTKQGDLVFILFGGSGNEILKTQKMGRHYLSSEIIPEYCKEIEKKLINC